MYTSAIVMVFSAYDFVEHLFICVECFGGIWAPRLLVHGDDFCKLLFLKRSLVL